MWIRQSTCRQLVVCSMRVWRQLSRMFHRDMHTRQCCYQLEREYLYIGKIVYARVTARMPSCRSTSNAHSFSEMQRTNFVLYRAKLGSRMSNTCALIIPCRRARSAKLSLFNASKNSTDSSNTLRFDGEGYHRTMISRGFVFVTLGSRRRFMGIGQGSYSVKMLYDAVCASGSGISPDKGMNGQNCKHKSMSFDVIISSYSWGILIGVK
ncbi:hypothetical protein BKA93DRAFT_27991 [Sparassis latifolia]